MLVKKLRQMHSNDNCNASNASDKLKIKRPKKEEEERKNCENLWKQN